jgi:uncharacterized protein YkwD
MIAVDLLVILIVAYAAYRGTRRGMLLISFELSSFAIATWVALVLYRPAGEIVKYLSGISTALSDVSAFIFEWIVVEIVCALIVRFAILPRLPHHYHFHLYNRIGGAVLNAVKYLVIVALMLVVFAGLPLPAGSKTVVTDANIPKILLGSTGSLQSWLGTGLGQDLSQSLNFYTVNASPESEERIDLGFETTGKPDPADEAKLLVLLNHERTSRGLPPLTMNQEARGVARNHSVDMFARGYFSHLTPEGKNPFDRMKAAGVKFGAAGENLALAPTLELAHQGLMNSPGHKANILSMHYKTVGIGIIDGGQYGLMVTQDFTD